MVVVPLCPLEHDLMLKEQKGDNLWLGQGSLLGMLVAWTVGQWPWWSCVPELRQIYEIHSKEFKHLLGVGNEKRSGSS